MDYLHQAIDQLPYTRSQTIKQLHTLGIKTYWDLIAYVPLRHAYNPEPTPIADVKNGEIATIRGIIVDKKMQYIRGNLTILKAVVQDPSGTITASWFNQKYLNRLLQKDMNIIITGTVKHIGHTTTLSVEEFEIMRPGTTHIHTRTITPIYSSTRFISSRTIREKIWSVLQKINEHPIEEYYPQDIVTHHHLMSAQDAYTNIHFPPNHDALQKARKRIAFDELIMTHLATLAIKDHWQQQVVSKPFTLSKESQGKLDALISSLPFPLTHAQTRSFGEIKADLLKDAPMNRFLQGDVGSGKTVVAALAAYVTFLNRKQTLIMAPTEILAQQHYETLRRIFHQTGLTIGLQTGSKKVSEQPQQINEYSILIGTHALISKSFDPANVGLVIIDEQHRFGVSQRAELKHKGMHTHLLTMTATPIPRTVSLTVYGELDLSVIDEMPQGRRIVKTWVVEKKKRNAAYQWIKQQIEASGEQVFVICPFVDESDKETHQSVKAVKKEHEKLSQIFYQHRVALIHGKMKPKEKDEIMYRFKQKEQDILVSTSLVEVGIDIPNATIMVIEGAERFGIAQLHQLRGRVGRSDKQSYCLLFTSDDKPDNNGRLAYFAKNHSGIKLAEFDLKIRGAGDIYGTRQHGFAEFKVADLSDTILVHETRKVAEYLFTTYGMDKLPRLKQYVERRHATLVSRD